MCSIQMPTSYLAANKYQAVVRFSRVFWFPQTDHTIRYIDRPQDVQRDVVLVRIVHVNALLRCVTDGKWQDNAVITRSACR